jgi:hypothetical protein
VSPAFSGWIQVLALLAPLVQASVEAVAGLVASIRATPGLTVVQQDAIVGALRAGLAAEVAAVEAVPVWRPAPVDPPQGD